MIDKSTIEWDPDPVCGEDPDAILWYGNLPSGLRVYERYVEEDSIYDADTSEELEVE